MCFRVTKAIVAAIYYFYGVIFAFSYIVKCALPPKIEHLIAIEN